MTKAPAGSGKGKLREPRRLRPIVSAVTADTALEAGGNVVGFIKPDYVRDALRAARGDYEVFRHEQRRWLSVHLGSLQTGIDTMYGLAASTRGIETADAALQGSMLGAGIIRLAVEDSAVPLEDCKSNVATWDTGFRGIEYTDDASEADIAAFYGQAASDEFMQIATPAARTMAVTIVGFASHARRQTVTSVALE